MSSVMTEEVTTYNEEGEKISAWTAGHLFREANHVEQIFLLNGQPREDSGEILDRTLLVVVPDSVADSYYELCKYRPTRETFDIADSPYDEDPGTPIYGVELISTHQLAEESLGFMVSNMLGSTNAEDSYYYDVLDITVYDFEAELKNINLVLVRANWRTNLDELKNMRSISANPDIPLEPYFTVPFDHIDFDRALNKAMVFDPETGSFTPVN